MMSHRPSVVESRSVLLQGINLANIIKDLKLNEDTGKPVLVESIEQLRAHAEGEAPLNDEDFELVVVEITKECDKVSQLLNDPDKEIISFINQLHVCSLCHTELWPLNMGATS